MAFETGLAVVVDSRGAVVGANEANRALNSMSAAAQRTVSEFNKLKASIFNIRNAIAAAGIGLLVRDIVQANVSLQNINNTFLAATGSAVKASAEFGFLRQEAQRLGLNLEGTAQAFARLLASSKGTSLEGEATRKIFTAVASAARVMGLSTEDATGALRAIEQMVSKGKVSMEELRLQLGDRMPGAFQIAARAMNVTTAELDKMISTGQLASDVFLPKFAAELEKAFGPGVASAIQSTGAQIERFKNALFELKTTFGQAGFLDAFTDAVVALTQSLRGGTLLAAVSTLGGAIKLLAENIDTATAVAVVFVGRALAPLLASLKVTTAAFYEKTKAQAVDLIASQKSIAANAVQAKSALDLAKAELAAAQADMAANAAYAQTAKTQLAASATTNAYADAVRRLIAQQGALSVAATRVAVAEEAVAVASTNAAAAITRASFAARAGAIAMGAFQGVMTILGGPAGIIFTAVTLLVLFGDKLLNLVTVADTAGDAVETLKGKVEQYSLATKEATEETATFINAQINQQIAQFKAQEAVIASRIAQLEATPGKGTESAIAGLENQKAALAGLRGELEMLAVEMDDNIRIGARLTKTNEETNESTKNLYKTYNDLPQSIQSATEAALEHEQALRDASDRAQSLITADENLANTLVREVMTPLEKYNERVAILNRLKPEIGVQAFNRQMALAAKELNEAQAALKGTVKGFDDLSNAVKAATAASVEHEQALKAASDRAQALIKSDEQLANTLTRDLMTPTERYNAGLRQLERLYNAERITQETFRRGMVDLRKEYDDASGATERLRKAEEERKKLLEQSLEPFKNAIESIQEAFADSFERIFSGGVDTFKELGKEVKSIFTRLAAEIAALLIFRPVVAGTLNAVGLGGLNGQLGLGGQAAGGILDIFKSGGSFLGKIFGGGSGVVGPMNGPIGASGLFGAAGGGLGSLLSTALPFIGIASALFGLSGLLGGSDKPSFGGVLNVANGKNNFNTLTADEGMTNADALKFGNAIGNAFTSAVKGLGGSVSGNVGPTSFGFTEGNGFFQGFSGVFHENPEDAVKAAVAEMLTKALKGGNLKGLDSDVARVLKAGLKDGLEKALDDAQFVMMLKGKAVDPFTDGAKALVAQFVEMGKRARELGLPLSLVTAKYRDAVKAYLEGVRQATEAQVQQLRSIAQSLRDVMVDLRFDDRLSPLNPEKRLTESRGLFTSTLRAAKGGDLEAASRLPDLARLFLTSSRDFNASSVAFGQDFALVEKTLKQFGISLDEQADDASEKTQKEVRDALVNMKELLAQIKAEATATRRQDTTGNADTNDKLDAINDNLEKLNRTLTRVVAGGR